MKVTALKILERCLINLDKWKPNTPLSHRRTQKWNMKFLQINHAILTISYQYEINRIGNSWISITIPTKSSNSKKSEFSDQ